MQHPCRNLEAKICSAKLLKYQTIHSLDSRDLVLYPDFYLALHQLHPHTYALSPPPFQVASGPDSGLGQFFWAACAATP